MNAIYAIAKREIKNYLITPFAYVFAVVFLLCSSGTFFYGFDFLAVGQADLSMFFSLHPWFYVLFIPAISMRLWAEEFKLGTIEILMTQPISTTQAVLGKFIAAWLFVGVVLLLTTPVWLTASLSGSPDNGVILASYIGSFMMAGTFLAVGSCMSALSGNQIMAFVLSVFVSIIFMVGGVDPVLDFIREWLPDITASALATLNFESHYEGIIKGLLDARDIVFFISVITFGLFINVVIVDMKKAD
ncbi:MAG: ABC transporter permease [Alphaproteobacteria bacterium]|nr:ABC transporter permease [Alphaproteobacteria bacterium]